MYMYRQILCCIVFQVPGKFELKGHDRVQSLSSLNVDRQNQFLPWQRRDVTYVSRLQVQYIGLNFEAQNFHNAILKSK